MLLTAYGASNFKPTVRLAELKPKIDLESQVPKSFGDWTIDPMLAPILPNPEVQAKLDTLYSATLARTYRNRAGQRVMVSIAYGSDQSSEATAVHRPEFCYSAQGFDVLGRGQSILTVGSQSLTVRRLVGKLGQRHEPITYWITMDEVATLPGFSRKYAQIRYGLRGEIPDGLLFRVSSIGTDESAQYALQQRFLSELAMAMTPATRTRYFGTQP